jgi:hypothetical protein
MHGRGQVASRREKLKFMIDGMVYLLPVRPLKMARQARRPNPDAPQLLQ